MATRANLTSWGEGASIALVGDPSSDDVMIKMPYRVDVLHHPALSAPHLFLFDWVKLNLALLLDQLRMALCCRMGHIIKSM